MNLIFKANGAERISAAAISSHPWLASDDRVDTAALVADLRRRTIEVKQKKQAERDEEKAAAM